MTRAPTARSRVVELAGILTVAAYAASLLGDQAALQPFVDDLAGSLKALRAPEVVVFEEPVEPPPRAVEPPPVPVESEWDPDPPEALMEASRSRALLLELIRRAAHDWVLYRTSRRMDQRELAQDAFIWLFEERPGHPRWEIREQEGMQLTAFLNICELLDLDPDFVRNRVRQMTPHGIKMAGRPAENRYRRGAEVEHYIEHSVELISLEDLEKYN